MSSVSQGHVWTMRAVFVGLGLLLLLAQLIPLETAPRQWVTPDLLLALTLVWVARRPDFTPIWAVAGLFLLADLLLQRPPGLWSGLALLTTEAVRARAHDFRDMIFTVECGIVGAVLIGFYTAYAVAWSLFVPFDTMYGLLAVQMLLTIMAYPLIAGLSGPLFGVRKTAPGQTDAQGRKL